MLAKSIAAMLAASISCNSATTSEEISISLVIIGAVAMISGAFVIKRALRWMSQSNERLSRGLQRVTKRGGIIYINPVGTPRNYPRGRPDECKPDASSGKSDRQGSDGKNLSKNES